MSLIIRSITPMKNTAIAKVFSDIAELLEIRGENAVKIRAYREAARAIEHSPKEIKIMLEEGEDLRNIPGVGKAIAQKTTELVTTEKLIYYENLKAEFPEDITNLLAIPGIGPKTANRLSNQGISSADALEQAINNGRLAKLFRLDGKTTSNILEQIQALRRTGRRIFIGEALPIVEEILGSLRSVPGVRNLTYAGSLRRFKETLGDIDLIGTADNPKEVMDAFVALPHIAQVLAQGLTKASAIVSGGLQIDLRMVERDSFGSWLQHFTGSKQHNISLKEIGHRQGLKLSEYGITDLATGKLEKFAVEEQFYHRLGLQYIPPELREAEGEVERAKQGILPKLVELSDIKGDLHIHTNWSDGHNSSEEMALAARDLGYQYMAITDHSVGRVIADGLDEERLKRHVAEIKALNERLDGIHVLSGIEVDILADGSLDLPHEILSELDVVVAAVHSAFNQSEEKMTKRVLRAIENPDVDIIAHPISRDSWLGPLVIDLEAIFRATTKSNKVLEINAFPGLLHLNDVYAFQARDFGVKLVIDSDAHSAANLRWMKSGVGVARRAWCEPQHILNTLSWEELFVFLKGNR